MFESKRKTIEEQTLIIDDAQFLDVKPTSSDTVDVHYLMQRDDAEIRLCISMQRAHALEIGKRILGLSSDQLRAMHTRKAAAAVEPVQAAELKPEEPEVYNTPPLNPPRVIELKPGPSKDINWKEIKATAAGNTKNRLTELQIEQLMHSVFRWRIKYRHADRANQRFESFQHYIEKTLPDQFGISPGVAKNIYAARSYTHITFLYKQQWVAFIKDMAKHHLERQIPRYLMDRWNTTVR